MTTFESRPFPFGIGVYSFWEAARYAGASARDLRRWIKAYSAKPRAHASTPLWDSQLLEWRRGDLGFRDVMELRFVCALRSAGLSLPVIRRVLDAGRDDLQVAYPLSSERFRERGRNVLLKGLAGSGVGRVEVNDQHRRKLMTILAGPRLRHGIEFGEDGQPARWFPVRRSRAIVLDPDRRAGEPILTDAGVPTMAIAAAFKADNNDARFVAWQYGISEAEVRIAIRFETRWRPV